MLPAPQGRRQLRGVRRLTTQLESGTRVARASFPAGAAPYGPIARSRILADARRGVSARIEGSDRERLGAQNEPMQVRFARHTDRLSEIVRFYRDDLGLPVRGEFRDHAGYDGVFFDLPGTGAHLEFTSGGGQAAPTPDPESLLVLYLDDDAELQRLAARLTGREITPANPYWQQNASAFLDPDGFQVLLVRV